MRFRFSIIALYLFVTVSGQLLPNPGIPEKLKTRHWDASWVTVPETGLLDYGVYFYRNLITIENSSEDFIIHITADNRYKLFVNGKLIGLGPARCEPANWIYDTYNLAEYLVPGENVIAAQVWNYGEYKPWAQMSVSTGFLVQGNRKNSEILNTPGTWKCIESKAHSPLALESYELGTFIVVGPGDEINGKEYPWKWKDVSYNDSQWLNPVALYPGSPKGVGTDLSYELVHRTIPAMELKKIQSPVIRMIDNIASGGQLKKYEIPANSKTSILLDQKELVTAYPELTISGGKGASIKISYAEALFDKNGKKQHRDSVTNLQFKGNHDIFLPDGKDNRTFTTLWFRTFRYVQIEISTNNEALNIVSFDPLYTAYPFEEKGYFKSDDESLGKIWKTGWRTARLCGNEIYYDCPYYEQMQYTGDTRIQALISLYISGDDRLMKKAIRDYYNSFIPEGLTQSRYPSNTKQIIPTFSLVWISMMHDYLWNRDDYMFVAQYLTNIQQVLRWFENRIDENTGMIGALEYWPFVDWTEEWPWDNTKRIGGVPPGGQDGNSSIITLQYAMTLKQASDIFNFFGLEALAKEYKGRANSLIKATRDLCWNVEKGLFADTPDQNSFSQHANTMAILSGSVAKKDQALFMEDVLRNKELIQASYYFRYYLHRAAIEAGLANKYLSWLAPWDHMLEQGLSTFAETLDTENTRSDCHAWSSSPLYELLNTVAGIQPAEAGFNTVLIAPHPGNLKWLQAGMPHYLGDISVDLKFDKDGGVKGEVILPEGLGGTFVWDSQTLDLFPGKQKIALKSLNSKYQIR